MPRLDARLRLLEARASWRTHPPMLGTGPVAARLALLLTPTNPSRAGDNVIVGRLADRLADTGRDRADIADVQAIVAEFFEPAAHAEAVRILADLLGIPEARHAAQS